MVNIAQLLTEHMDIWTAAETEKKSGRGRSSGNAGSVYGVKKLRELILELAVRGKLVPQDQNDEPASELLKRIQAEKHQLIAEGKLKKDKPLAPIAEDEKPFEVPKGWMLVRNCELFQLRKGRIPKILNEDGAGLPYLDIEALDRNVVRRYSEELTCPQSTESDILVVCDGSRSGLVLDGKNGIIGSTLSIIDTPIFIQNYIKLIFKQGFEIFNTSMKGAAIPHLDTQKLLQNPTALPPLAEQHRIVAKVDELMALCDQLEQQHNNAQEAHETLALQLLTPLTLSQNAIEFNTNWQRIYACFDVLFTTESSIDTLKQTLLQLAVMGKLVLQNPNDEPASELLKRIQAEKFKLIAEGKLKKEKQLAPIGEGEKLFKLPRGWQWVRFNMVANTRLGKMLDQAKNKGSYRPYLRNTNVQWFAFELDDLKEMRFEEHELDEYRVITGDLVICEGGEPGRCAIWESQHGDMFIQKALHRARPWTGISPYFLQLCFRVDASNGHLDQFFTGATIKHFSGEKLAIYSIPLPPSAEQHRIVAKVDAITALCDQLKTRIQQANQQQQAIADALVSQAVA
jgi:type I restriction enzyme, S subunit